MSAVPKPRESEKEEAAKKESRIDRCPESLRQQRAFRLSPDLSSSSRRKVAPRRLADPAIPEKLSAGRLRLRPVMLDVVLRCFCRVMRGVVKVPLSRMRVVRRRLVIAFFVVRCRFAMMTRRVFVVFRCLMMMLCRLLRHSFSSFLGQPDSSGPR
jgi:hypothetical protein